MPDEADFAQAAEEMFLRAALHGARSSPALRAVGSCHNCGERLAHEAQLFCDRDCADDYARRQRLRGE